MICHSAGEFAGFAASNSEKGFLSHYGELFGEARVRKVFIIKGGPGTGKSRFLREVMMYAVKRGYSAEVFYCSSDPASLDAVILTRGEDTVALADATPPHLYEASMPGAREEIVDLGAFWNTGRLAEALPSIREWNERKHAAYERCYRYLAAYGNVSRVRDALVAPYVLHERLNSYAEHLLSDTGEGTAFSARPFLIRSIGMKGEAALDTFAVNAKKVSWIEDCRGTAQYLMRHLFAVAQRKRLALLVSHDPIEVEKIDGLFLPASKEAFVTAYDAECPVPHKTVRLRRFVDTGAMHGIRSALNHAEQGRRFMKEGALGALREASAWHFRLEEVYSSAMDFSAKEAFTKAFCKAHFSLQND